MRPRSKNSEDRLDREPSLDALDGLASGVVSKFENGAEEADGVLIVDDLGVVVRWVNRAAQRILGKPARDIVGWAFGFPLEVWASMRLSAVRPDGEKSV